METVLLGRGSIRTNAIGYRALVEFYYRCYEYKGKEVLIDFSRLNRFDANISALLYAICYKLERENKLSFYVEPSVIQENFSSLIRNGFLKNVVANREGTGSEIKLEGFSKNEDTRFISFIETDLLSYKRLRISKTDRLELIDAFLEVFCNVQKHAKTDDPIFACGQYFSTLNKLGFTLVDSGIGYLAPIQKFTKGQINHATEAIAWALEGNSTKADAPGGLGLQRILAFCKNNKAHFDIVTGDAYWNNILGFDERGVKPFCGTTVNIIFDAK